MRVYINGESKDFPATVSLQQLIEFLELKPERIAVELNGLVVPRTDWATRSITDGDRLEIIHFVGGGTKPATDEHG